MIILGVTGGIGSGKSFACNVLKRLKHVRSISSDALVHSLYKHDSELREYVKNKFPEAIKKGVVDRSELGKKVFGNDDAIKELEGIIYPKLSLMRQKFLKECIKARTKIVVFEIPLLFENSLQFECDYVLTIYCSEQIQKQRVLRRKSMTEKLFNSIVAKQMSTHEKLRLTDFAINSGGSKANTVREIKQIYDILTLC